MDARVWKYEIGAPDARCRSFVWMANGARPLSVGIQNNAMVVWALVTDDPTPENELDEGSYRLIVANTGAVVPDFPEGARFLGTITTDNGIVWHVWNGDEETTA